MDAIQTVNLTKRFKNFVTVDNLNLSIEQGELFALLGVNGAGKPTIIKILSDLLVLFSIVLSNIVLFNYIGNYATYGTFGFVFCADAFPLVAVYLLLLPHILRRGHARGDKYRSTVPTNTCSPAVIRRLWLGEL